MGFQLKRSFSGMRVRQQLLLLLSVMICPIFALNLYGNYRVEGIMKRQVIDAYVEINKQNHYVINRDIDAINRSMTTIIQNPVTQQLIPSDEDTPLVRLSKFNAMGKLLDSYSIGVNSGDAIIYSFFVYDPHNLYSFAPKNPFGGVRRAGVYFFTDQGKPPWYDAAVERKGRGYLRVIDPFSVNYSDKQRTLAYLRATNNISRSNEVIGVLVATNVDKKIAESFRTVSLPEGGELYFTDEGNHILASTGAAVGTILDVPKELKASAEGKSDAISSGYIYVMSNDPVSERNLIYKVSLQSVLRQQNEVKSVIQVISIAFLIFAVGLMMYFWRSLMAPIQKLAYFVRSYEPGNALPAVQVKQKNDEVGVLVTSVYEMAERLNALVRDKYQMDIRQKESQLQLLYQQINPHLLYNTLESIYWKSSLEGKAETAEMIKDLSKLMRISLSKGRELITLKEELEHASAYVNLQLKRYDFSFGIKWQVEDELANILIPKVTLQPLIENAIIHGVKNMGADGEIVISAAAEGEKVFITVADNGYRKANIEDIRRLLSGESGNPALGYGIRNIHERLQLQFGKEYGLHYELGAASGLRAIMVIPLSAESSEGEPNNAPYTTLKEDC